MSCAPRKLKTVDQNGSRVEHTLMYLKIRGDRVLSYFEDFHLN